MIHINRFIDKIKALESKNSKNFNMTIQDAKDLHSDITKILLAYADAQEKVEKSSEVIQVNIDGGNW